MRALPTHPLFKNLIGEKFARLKVIEYGGRIKSEHAFICICDCGKKVKARSYLLTSGGTKSCGCLLPERNRERLTTHGLGGSKVWRIWSGMKNRCLNDKCAAYPRYGGAGVIVCNRWINGDGFRTGFECFIADMGERPSPDHSIDRFPDPAGNYEPSNCRWATRSQQAQNMRSTKTITHDGQRKTVHQWAISTKIPAHVILKRLGRGWSEQRALTQELRK